MIIRSVKRCIAVMTREEVERHKAVATAAMNAESRARVLDLFGRKLRQVTLDKAGRISIPDELCKELGLERELWLSGAVDTFNIWNVSDFEAEKARERAAENDFLRQLGI
ncbi:MAG: Transcriptional regulator MraZ [Chthoniobacter sp.]|jgi:DNA-binding transcriptional regulator/RsmH inhibitor MraZ|nr:Transcriptional regulator MraZ [Chthoniobacter sp.]